MLLTRGGSGGGTGRAAGDGGPYAGLPATWDPFEPVPGGGGGGALLKRRSAVRKLRGIYAANGTVISGTSC